jgi:WD40 repeat protein
VAGTGDRQVVVWDAVTGAARGALRGTNPPRSHSSAITAVTADNSQGLMATGDNDGTIMIWNPLANDPRKVCLKTVAVGGGIHSLSWRSNGSRIAAGLLSGQVVSFDPKVSTRAPASRAGNVPVTRGKCSDFSIQAVAWNPVHPNYLAFGDARGVLWIADMTTGRPVCGRAENALQARLSLAGANPPIPVNSPISQMINIVELPCSGCRQLAWSPKGDRFVAVEAELEMWEFTPPAGLRLSDVSFDASEAGVTSRPVSPARASRSRRGAFPGKAAGGEAARGSSPFEDDPFAADVGRRAPPVGASPTSGRVTSVAWDPEGERLAALLSYSNRVAVWNANTGALLQWWDGPAGSTSLLWSPDGTQLAVASPAGIGVWAVGTAGEASNKSSGE